MTLALYRKYRPRSFSELIGQDHVTEPLMQALRTGRLNHAYLFSGPRGCGKTSSARILARSLNCDKGPTPDPCGECESCRALAPDGPGSIDVIEIDAASHGGVDDARDLRERAFFAPAISRYKIYIIDEAHMVSSAGFNALLKLVEEPPDYVKFVFATTEPEKVLGTIKSRTHHYPFRLIPPGVLRPYLEELCVREGVTVEPAVFPLVVRAGGGSARDSISVLDQLIAGAGEGGVSYARAVALLGVTDSTLIDEACDALAAGDGAAAFATIDRVAEAGLDPRRFAGDQLERLRDLILLRQVPDAAAKGLIDAPADQLERMQAHAGQLGPATLSRWADIVHNGLVEMRGTTSPRLLLELITARMLLPAADDSTAALLARLERLESGAVMPARPADAAPTRTGDRPADTAPARPADTAPADTAPARPAEAPSRPAAASRPVEAPVQVAPAVEETSAPPAVVTTPQSAAVAEFGGARTGQGVEAADVRRAWNEILGLLGRGNKRVAAMARDAVVREVEGDTIVLVFAHTFHLNSITSDSSALLAAIAEVIGGSWKLRCELGGDQRSAAPAMATRPRPAETAPQPAAAEDWPTPAAIGGDPAPAAPAKAAPPAKSAAPARARAAAKGAPAKAAPAKKATTDEEPPYDPEFDGPAPAAAYDGFAPGDGPTDEIIDAGTARKNSRQQALDVVKQTFTGAETIGEVDAR